MSTKTADIKLIGENLSGQGWSISQGLFEPTLLQALFDEACRHEMAESLTQASVGHHANISNPALRGDSTLWLDDHRCSVASKQFLDALDSLRIELNHAVILGLESTEAHFAIYPPGTGYAKHRDRFRDDDARVLSLVCYLNADWPENAGGELRLHLATGTKDIAPDMGTTAIFLSEEIEHEVLSATMTRYSIAAWFRQHKLPRR